MARRFAGARRITLAASGGNIRSVVAERFGLRLMGLMRLGEADLEPVLFPRCRSVHTLGMRAPIDVVWLDLVEAGGSADVIGITARVAPRRRARAPRGTVPRARIAALELAGGSAELLGVRVGDRLAVLSDAQNPPQSGDGHTMPA